MSRKIYIKTYGCQMNVYDSERMARLMAAHGYDDVDTPGAADLVVLNTCHIREKAAEKVYSELGRLRELRDGPGGNAAMRIAVAGCVAQAEGEAMLERMPEIDIVVGPQAYHRLPELLALRARSEGGVVDTEFPVVSKFDSLPLEANAEAISAFVTIQEGCDKFCTFCVVPYTRGAEVSRPAADVVEECRRRVEAGAREIVLLGQNVNAYRGDAPDGGDWSLGRLIRALAEIDGLDRIRYTTSHPRDMAEDLISAHRDVPQLMPFVHLPVQSGSDRVLAAMNRRHTVSDYLRLIDRLRSARADLALSSDFIVGFPGERDEDFEATLSLVRAVGFAQSFSFKYSSRPGTPGSVMPKQIGEKIKSERLQSLQELLARQMVEYQRASIGRRLSVLFTKPGRHAGQLVGQSAYQQAVHVKTECHRIGDLVDVDIEHAGPHSLAGSIAVKSSITPQSLALAL